MPSFLASFTALLGGRGTRRPASGPRPRVRPELEALEDKSLLSVTIRLLPAPGDTFFANNPKALAALQTAARKLTQVLNDTPDQFTLPAGFPAVTTVDPVSPFNSFAFPQTTFDQGVLTVYYGGSTDRLPGIGEGWAAYYFTGQNNTPVRGYLPLGGSVSFETDPKRVNWYFEPDIKGIKPGQQDFLTFAEHELGHVLGFGMSASAGFPKTPWDQSVVGTTFVGPAATGVYGKPVPLDPVVPGHWADFQTLGTRATMQEVQPNGQRVEFTALDFAALQDIGWHLAALPGARPHFKAHAHH
jgi:hypothetical protein